MSSNSFYTKEELRALPFKRIGDNVLISKKASFYNIERISIGNNVRIDDFCILSGSITLKNYIHISAQSLIYGKFDVRLDDFSGLSPGCKLFSQSDDFSGEYLIGPMVPEGLTNVSGGPIKIGKYSQIGAASIVLPSVSIGEGSVVGAMSLVNTSLNSWGIYAGIPVRLIKSRSRNIIELERKFRR